MRGVYEKVPGSGVWWIRWTDGEGKLHREKAGRRGDASTLVAARKTDVLRGKQIPEKFRKRVTFNTLCDDAIEHSKATNTAKVTTDLEVKVAKLRPAFGERGASDITKQEVVRWLSEQTLARDWMPATVNRYKAALSLIFRVGIDNQKVEKNPAALIQSKREGHGRIRFLQPEEETRLRAVMQRRCPEQIPALTLAINTGLRMTEQYSLRWEQVDFERRLLSLYETKNATVRHIPLNIDALEALRSLHNNTLYVFPNASNDGPILSPKGWFVTALKEAGIKTYSWHCHRHTFASRLVMAGVDLRTIAALLGHKGMQMTMRYAHLAPEHTAAAVARLNRTLTPELAPPV